MEDKYQLQRLVINELILENKTLNKTICFLITQNKKLMKDKFKAEQNLRGRK